MQIYAEHWSLMRTLGEFSIHILLRKENHAKPLSHILSYEGAEGMPNQRSAINNAARGLYNTVQCGQDHSQIVRTPFVDVPSLLESPLLPECEHAWLSEFKKELSIILHKDCNI